MMDKILLIDDDPNNILALAAVLHAKGLSTITASSAEQGMQKIKEQSGIKIVLLDMMMPETDGYEMLAQLRNEQYHDLPVIAVTAQAMKGDREKCLEAGATDYVSKPIDIDKLIALIQKYF